MACYSLNVKPISRGKGHSAIAAAAYRSGSTLECERYGVTQNYSRKQGVVESFILAPENAPEWVQDREALWNAVEAIEDRKNSQLARDLTIALPEELTDEERVALVATFIQDQFVDRGMIADVNIHRPHHEGDERNHHAHVMLTLREISEEMGWDKNKNRDWNANELLLTWREKWADYQNQALENGQHLDRVDHRSYEAQGKNREATQHMGHNATEMMRRGEESDIAKKNKDIQKRNRERERMEKMSEVMELQAQSKDGSKLLRDPEELRAKLQDRLLMDRADMQKRHERQNTDLEAKIEENYGEFLREMEGKKTELTDKLSTEGIKGVMRSISGMNFMDRRRLGDVDKSLANAMQRIEEMRDGLANEQKLDQYHRDVDDRKAWKNLEGFIDSGQTHEYYRDRSYAFRKSSSVAGDRDGQELSIERSLTPKGPTIH